MDMVREETRGDPERRARVLTGLRAFQQAPRPHRPPEAPVVARAGGASLRDYGGKGQPAIFVPSLINPPLILDLAEENSLLRWLAQQGVRPLLVDWGEPNDPHLDIAGHVTERLLPLIEEVGEPVHLVGYCLGGTMALAAAARAAPLSLTLIASPWHFAGFGDLTRAEIGALWQAAKPSAERLGLVPMEVLQTGFWRLDPARTIAKYEAFAQYDPASDLARSFVALEDWANAGSPLTYAAGRELFEDMIGSDVTGQGQWLGVDPSALNVPTLEFASLSDRIVPAASSSRLPNQRLLGLGHVGMIVGSRAREQLWEPLAAMLSQPQQS